MLPSTPLTYKSRRAHICGLIKGERLWRYIPKSLRSRRRELYLTASAVSDLESPQSAVNLLGLRGYIESAMTDWVLGEWVHVHEGGGGTIKQLCEPPPEVWELRISDPEPQVRGFCRFVLPNALVTNRFRLRNTLQSKGSREWSDAMRDCVAAWNDLFPDMAPHGGEVMADYVTESCDDFPIDCPDARH